MISYITMPLLIPALICGAIACEAVIKSEKDLNLVPFPKKVEMAQGRFKLESAVIITVTNTSSARRMAEALRSELLEYARVPPEVQVVSAKAGLTLCLSAGKGQSVDALPNQAGSYKLMVTGDAAVVGAADEAGLISGIQTLRQLVRANVSGGSIPCLTITDYPTLKMRGFQDDLTRGPSSKLSLLESEIDMGSYLKMNFWTYYMEHQFSYSKHPDIGPKGGCFTPTELNQIVKYAKSSGVEVIGCQQSFGHFHHILKHDKYKELAETTWVINPTNEKTYELLDDLYSDQAPLIDSPFFNVCCDETDGLGEGPSKSLVAEIGIGGVYTRHLARIHDILRDKYGKRMMAWGDIILRHPDHLAEIPKDTVMLSWGYHAAPSFEETVIPFEKAGYEFFVCPGVNCWNRILPDFDTSVVNIHNYVRDGVKHGASGMLNTVWDDDGENLYAANWHGLAWGAECAWNGSTTEIEDFNRRLGAVLFGEKKGDFGRAIQLLGKLHSMPGYDAMFNRRFWQVDNWPVDSLQAGQARALLAVVDPALKHLRAVKESAVYNADIVDHYIFVTERVKLMATRELDFLHAAKAYREAETADADIARKQVSKAISLLNGIRDRHVDLRDRYRVLWLAENKPYSLDWVTARYNTLIAYYDSAIKKAEDAAEAFASGKPLPKGTEVGLALVEVSSRKLLPPKIVNQPLMEDAPWVEENSSRRLAIEVAAGDSERRDLPVEVELPKVDASGARLYEMDSSKSAQTPVLLQVEKTKQGSRIVFVARDQLLAGTRRRYILYLNPGKSSDRAPGNGVTIEKRENGVEVENKELKLFLGSEGAHIFRWEVKRLNNLDLTAPGESDWRGFGDIMGQYRNAPNKIEILERGQVRVRVRCTDAYGIERTFNIYAGVPWVEVVLRRPSHWFWLYDNATVMGAASATPGKYEFSNGVTGPVEKTEQVVAHGVFWSCKYRPDGLLLGLITPDVAISHTIGPGGDMGGVGIQTWDGSDHFVMYGGLADELPKKAMDTLKATLELSKPSEVTIYAVQAKQ